MTNRLLVTGTDTGVGKTAVTCMIAAASRQAGLRVGVLKPVETGWADEPDTRHDAVALRKASGADLPIEMICPYRFSDALAPSVAARRAGSCIDMNLIQDRYRTIAETSDLTLVEGAGGLMVPLTATATFADLAEGLDLTLLVVVGSRLGAINHTLLTIETARHHHLNVLGYVLNHPWAVDASLPDSNRRAIAELTDVACLGTLPYLPLGSGIYSEATQLAFFARKHLDLSWLGIGSESKR